MHLLIKMTRGLTHVNRIRTHDGLEDVSMSGQGVNKMFLMQVFAFDIGVASCQRFTFMIRLNTYAYRITRHLMYYIQFKTTLPN